MNMQVNIFAFVLHVLWVYMCFVNVQNIFVMYLLTMCIMRSDFLQIFKVHNIPIDRTLYFASLPKVVWKCTHAHQRDDDLFSFCCLFFILMTHYFWEIYASFPNWLWWFRDYALCLPVIVLYITHSFYLFPICIFCHEVSYSSVRVYLYYAHLCTFIFFGVCVSDDVFAISRKRGEKSNAAEEVGFDIFISWEREKWFRMRYKRTHVHGCKYVCNARNI